MTEPTIDEMLQWVDDAGVWAENPIREAIRAILEQHHALSADGYVIDSKGVFIPHGPTVAIIRAFVERVEERWTRDGYDFREVFKDALSAMEQETANERTND